MNETTSATPNPPAHGYLQADEPITRRSEDQLGRAPLAEAIANQVLQSPPGQAFVIALDGAWGSGKTSVLNMIEEVVVEQSDTVVVRFNPWLFSGTEELVLRFLYELGTQLRELGEVKEKRDEQLRQIGERLTRYGDALVPLGWVPVLGGVLSRVGVVMRAAGGLRERKPLPSALSQYRELRDALLALQRRVLVVVDDLDRVEDAQIRDVVRLIKLVADFPNVTYLLGYDSERVAAALGNDPQSGRTYLEKIVQVTHRLPEISDSALVRLLANELEASLALIEHGPFSHDDWVNVFHTSIRPYFKTIRDVNRYLNAVPVTLRILGREVALVDALALEALRIFAPGAYARLAGMVATLTGEGVDEWRLASREREEADAAAVQQFIAATAPHQRAVEEMLRRLFPRVAGHVGGQNVVGGVGVYRRGRRVAHPDVLRLYLRQTLPEGVSPAAVVEDAFNNLTNRERLTLLLDSLDSDELEDLLGRLRDYEGDFDSAEGDVAIDVLINQIPYLREETRGMLDFGAHFAVTGLVLRILKDVSDEDERLGIVERALPRIAQLSGREELIDLVGHRENTGHKLVSPEEADRLYRDQNKAVLTAEPSTLTHERQLASLLYRAVEFDGGAHRSRVRELCDDDAVFLQLLRSALSEHRGQTVGDLVVRSTPALPWSMLADIVGEDGRLKQRVADVGSRVTRDQLDDRTQLALATAEKYAEGELHEPRLSGPPAPNQDA